MRGKHLPADFLRAQGLTHVVGNGEAGEICKLLDSLSRPYSTAFTLRDDGMIVLEL